jgi:hypothetical protein
MRTKSVVSWFHLIYLMCTCEASKICDMQLDSDINSYSIYDGEVYQIRSIQTTCKKCDDIDILHNRCKHFHSSACYNTYAVMHYGPSKKSCNLCLIRGSDSKESAIKISSTLKHGQKMKVYASTSSKQCQMNLH